MVDSGIVYNHYIWFIVAIILNTVIVNRGVYSEYKSNKWIYSTCLMFECFSQFCGCQNHPKPVGVQNWEWQVFDDFWVPDGAHFLCWPPLFVDPWRNGQCWLPRIPFDLISNGHHHYYYYYCYYYYYYYCHLNGGIFWYESKLWHTTIVWTPN